VSTVDENGNDDDDDDDEQAQLAHLIGRFQGFGFTTVA
jgi:hypothetical protein